MTKVLLEIPAWNDEEIDDLRSTYIFKGIELFAYRHRDGNWFVKSSRCNMCGKCCMGLKKHSYPLIDGRCIHLKKEAGNNPRWLCELGLSRPFSCSIGTPSNMPDCTEKFVEVID